MAHPPGGKEIDYNHEPERQIRLARVGPTKGSSAGAWGGTGQDGGLVLQQALTPALPPRSCRVTVHVLRQHLRMPRPRPLEDPSCKTKNQCSMVDQTAAETRNPKLSGMKIGVIIASRGFNPLVIFSDQAEEARFHFQGIFGGGDFSMGCDRSVVENLPEANGKILPTDGHPTGNVGLYIGFEPPTKALKPDRRV